GGAAAAGFPIGSLPAAGAMMRCPASLATAAGIVRAAAGGGDAGRAMAAMAALAVTLGCATLAAATTGFAATGPLTCGLADVALGAPLTAVGVGLARSLGKILGGGLLGLAALVVDAA